MTDGLDASRLPLSGVQLIEASAGTGKTFTLANVYLRLLIDGRDHPPSTVEQILVVTFTNAATEELRARIRDRVSAALAALAGTATPDASLCAILDPHRDAPETVARLTLAYRSIDQAAIFTIHGFCERVLREHAFESGQDFDAELQADDAALLRAATEAWWRQVVTPMSRDEIDRLPEGLRDPSALQSRLRPVIGDPAGALVPDATDSDATLWSDAERAWRRFAAAWSAEHPAWLDALSDAAGARQIKQGKRDYCAANLARYAAEAAAVAAAEDLPSQLPGGLEALGTAAVNAAANKNKTAPTSALGDLVDAVVELHRRWRFHASVSLQHRAHAAIDLDLAARKRAARVRTFSDLLVHVHSALHQSGGDALVARLRAQYPFALIDEFQDTDRIQYGVFERVYRGIDVGALYLIGDPKQAIYRFRGADIDVYLRARAQTDAQHRLDVNWRSSARLVNALNAVYAASPAPFGAADIVYHPVAAAGAADARALRVAGEGVAPLQFDVLETAGEKLPRIDASREALAEACARRVQWLLRADSATLGERPVTPADIAVLVRTHAEGVLVARALKACGVDSAMQSRDSVGHSAEALDIIALMRALVEPVQTGSVSRVLVSPLASYGADELIEARDDAGRWQAIEARVDQCRAVLAQAGPLAAVLRFAALFETTKRLKRAAGVRVRGAERVLGNYLHLAELLQAAWDADPDPRALVRAAVAWRDDEGDGDSLQLRLESDEALVQIVTLHKSKGLQYPIVLLPFVSVGRASPPGRTDTVAYTEAGAPRVDLGSPAIGERRRAVAAAEADEAMRVLYVGLTRAEHGCWVPMTPNKHIQDAALCRLLGLSLSAKEAPALAHDQMVACLDALQATCPDILRSSPPTADRIGPPSSDRSGTAGAARRSSRALAPSWRVGSYSALARGATVAAERPDHDAVDATADPAPPSAFDNPFAFPRGAAAGTLVHAVFEHIEFDRCDGPDLDATVLQHLRAHAVDTRWAPALTRLVSDTVACRLPGSGAALSDIGRHDRLDELGFHFPVERLQADDLVAVLRDIGVLGTEDTLQFDTLDGYMTGFIDLVFRHDGRWYIADYKSNHLGHRVEDYGEAALAAAMRHHRYDLQYLIYAVALIRYLRKRLGDVDIERDFGGVYYLFVRGMRPTTDGTTPTGVFHACPDAADLERVDRVLSGRGARG